MASTDVAPVLAREFVPVKIDFDRMPGAKDLAKQYQEKAEGLPWFVFLDSDAKAIITATGPDGKNVGFPVQPSEIAHFEAMLDKARRHLTDAEIDGLVESLQAANKKVP
jgi:uncharacterized protein YyaL (SSP411 family)